MPSIAYIFMTNILCSRRSRVVTIAICMEVQARMTHAGAHSMHCVESVCGSFNWPSAPFSIKGFPVRFYSCALCSKCLSYPRISPLVVCVCALSSRRQQIHFIFSSIKINRIKFEHTIFAYETILRAFSTTFSCFDDFCLWIGNIIVYQPTKRNWKENKRRKINYFKRHTEMYCMSK